MKFELHPQLEADTIYIASLDTCELLLMNDSRWHWLILVPRIEEAVEWHELFTDQRQDIDFEIANTASALKAVSGCEKINIASLGNMVRQLHIHIVARYSGDANWPGPIWGYGERAPYSAEQLQSFVSNLQHSMGLE